MATELVMPRLGWTMEEGTLVEWLKHDGDTIKTGDLLFTVESDKALNEVEAFEDGILRIPPDSPPPGSVIPVGGLLAYLVRPGEAVPFGEAKPQTDINADSTSNTVISTSQTASAAPTSNGAGGSTQSTLPTISPRARRVAHELGIDWTRLQGSGRTGRIVERDVRAALERPQVEQISQPAPSMPQRVEASPVARRAAQELGVDLDHLSTQMPGKRIMRQDVERAAESSVPALREERADGTRLPISRVRSIIGERMTASSQTTAAVTLTTEVDATELVRLRKQLKSDSPAADRPVPSYNDLLVKICAVALGEHPMLNARFEGDAIVQPSAIHIGLAVNSERGLLVPVIRNVEAKNIRQIAAESNTLITRARAGTLKADEMGGGTFSISNLGMYEIDAFTPIINLPECAILGVGRIVPKVIVTDAEAEQTAIRQMLFLSLTFDHRLVDGAPAARFLQRIKQFIENPYLWLVE